MKTTKLLFTALTSLMLLTTACDKKKGPDEAAPAAADPGVSASCLNCSGFVAGSSVFSGKVSSGAFHIDNLTVIADKNSLATATQATSSSPRINGTYQGLVTGGTFTASGSSCVGDGTYQVSGLQVGMISPDLSTESTNPMWVTLTGPTTIKAPIYIKLVDTNSDDIGDTGTMVYVWFYCSGAWASVGMAAQ